jgi:Ca-activated chloride channel homolog
LLELASETGGRVFHDNASEAEICEGLRTIEGDLRNQYQLVYRSEELKHDGSFHGIALIGPERLHTITVRSGYYAPAH